MTRAEELIRRLGDAQRALGDRELTRMARAAASTERLAPRPPRRTGARAAAGAAAAAAILSTTVTGSVLGWTHGSPAHPTTARFSVPAVQFSALALLQNAARR
jgi:hypothetical protein